ncbi:sperm-specific protein PHI-2B-like [Gigantopelta aegis]|uniref:sperm-specific protein PHI-2B-like n=1 Tax=Gigantopelta aegis TaxID=1735272 RepID=UPI001B88C311|nr:sperm-specific protein PHI-2B-like [Gigantopelta aegis]
MSRSRSRSQSSTESMEDTVSSRTTRRHSSSVEQPTAMVMKVVDAITQDREMKGSSLQSIRKQIAANCKAMPVNLLNGQIKKAINMGLSRGFLVRPKGSKAKGTVGRFRLGKIPDLVVSRHPRHSRSRSLSGSRRRKTGGDDDGKGKSKGGSHKKRKRSKSSKKGKSRTKSRGNSMTRTVKKQKTEGKKSKSRRRKKGKKGKGKK